MGDITVADDGLGCGRGAGRRPEGEGLDGVDLVAQFDDDALNQLADSITENGLLQPIAVRPKKLGTGYIIIAGERRWRAARLAGLDEVPVIIKDVTDEQAAALEEEIRNKYGAKTEITFIKGGQPVYYYLISAE